MGEASTPVVTVEFISNGAPGAFSCPLPISPAALTIVKRNRPFEWLSALTGASSTPMSATACLECVSSLVLLLLQLSLLQILDLSILLFARIPKISCSYAWKWGKKTERQYEQLDVESNRRRLLPSWMRRWRGSGYTSSTKKLTHRVSTVIGHSTSKLLLRSINKEPIHSFSAHHRDLSITRPHQATKDYYTLRTRNWYCTKIVLRCSIVNSGE